MDFIRSAMLRSLIYRATNMIGTSFHLLELQVLERGLPFNSSTLCHQWLYLAHLYTGSRQRLSFLHFSRPPHIPSSIS